MRHKFCVARNYETHMRRNKSSKIRIKGKNKEDVFLLNIWFTTI